MTKRLSTMLLFLMMMMLTTQAAEYGIIIDGQTENDDKPDIEMPLTIKAKEDANMSISNPKGFTFGYSVNDGPIEWTTNISERLYPGDKVELYGNNMTYSSGVESLSTNIRFDGDCYVYGNVMSLIKAEGFETLSKLENAYTFAYLFSGNTRLLSHPSKHIVLPALELTNECYHSMFYGCSEMTKAPKLLATILTAGCYKQMFEKCTSLEEAPELPAATLEEHCYDGMFIGCTSLTDAPLLLAEELKPYCYKRMFEGCSSLTSVTCLAVDHTAQDCTDEWLAEVSGTGTFTHANGVAWDAFSTSGIPMGWISVVDDTKQLCGLAFTPTELTVNYGETYTLPTLTNPHELPVTYSSSNPTIATVDAETGVLNILKVGTTIITARFAGSSSYYFGYASYTLTTVGKGDSPIFVFNREGAVTTYGKSFTAPVLTMSDGLTANYSSDNTSVATVEQETGKVTIHGKGVATITATTDGNMEFVAASAKYYLMVLTNAEEVRCDANGDGEITISDVVDVVNIILNSSGASAQ